MSDYSYKGIYLPSKYDRGYRDLIKPYNFNNISYEEVCNNLQIINDEIATAIYGKNKVRLIRIINSIDRETEKDATYEQDIADTYGYLINKWLGSGNWDLTLKPNVNKEQLEEKGYNIEDTSILYPQEELYWCPSLNKLCGIWYTPFTKDLAIKTKSEIKEYLLNLVSNSDILYNDTWGIILKIDTKLGFSVGDILSFTQEEQKYSSYIQKTLKGLRSWSKLLTNCQLTYQNLKKVASTVNVDKYLFIDEDKNIFNEQDDSFFIFNVNQNYYGDLADGLGFFSETIPVWAPETKYKVGDYVLGTSDDNDDGTAYNCLYKCIYEHTSSDYFKLTVTKKHRTIDSEGKQIISKISTPYWEFVSKEYAKEIAALDGLIDPNEYYRFVFPVLEDRIPLEYYPNGQLKPDTQEGTIIWGQQGVSIFSIAKTEIKDDQIVETTEQNYINNVNDRNDKKSSPNTSNFHYYNSSRKIVRYIKKDAKNTLIFVRLKGRITHIIDRVFYQREDLIKVSFGSAIKQLGNEIFYNCSNLKQCILPKNLKSLGVRAFASCTNLKRATLPDNITSLVGTYIGCTNLDSVSLSKKTITLEDSAFTNCYNLKKVYNTEKLITIGENCFNGCEKLEKFYIPSTVTRISNRAFKNCNNCFFTIETENITELGEEAFFNCEKLEGTINFQKVEELKDGTYKNCSNITSIRFNLKETANKIIPKDFCYGCYNLKELDLGNIEILKDSCFQNCASLRSVVIPPQVSEVGLNVFYDCFSLKEVKIPEVYPIEIEGQQVAWLEKITENVGNKNNWIDRTFTELYYYDGEQVND